MMAMPWPVHGAKTSARLLSDTWKCMKNTAGKAPSTVERAGFIGPICGLGIISDAGTLPPFGLSYEKLIFTQDGRNSDSFSMTTLRGALRSNS